MKDILRSLYRRRVLFFVKHSFNTQQNSILKIIYNILNVIYWILHGRVIDVELNSETYFYTHHWRMGDEEFVKTVATPTRPHKVYMYSRSASAAIVNQFKYVRPFVCVKSDVNILVTVQRKLSTSNWQKHWKSAHADWYGKWANTVEGHAHIITYTENTFVFQSNNKLFFCSSLIDYSKQMYTYLDAYPILLMTA